MSSEQENEAVWPKGRAPLVSVVIPSFNRTTETHSAIASVLAQTYRPIEIVVVDDASSPAFSAQAAETNGVAIRVLRNAQNEGAAASRQKGVEASHGAFVAFLDSDDFWFPQKIERQMALLHAEPHRDMVAVACGWVARYEDTRGETQRMPIESRDADDFASGCWFCPGATVLVSRRAFDHVGPFDAQLRRLEDLDWFLRFALKGGVLRVVPMIGASVATGRRGRLADVSAAAETLLQRFSDGPKLTHTQLRRFRAYLELECATAARNEGRIIRMLGALAQSFALVPRRHLALKQWWPKSQVKPGQA
jgi:glycosyltransferase involved in cell wall biosynthesis